MKIEQDHALGAGSYEQSEAHKGHANRYRPRLFYIVAFRESHWSAIRPLIF